jgi:hypothetical protein
VLQNFQPFQTRWWPGLLSRYSNLLRAGRCGDRILVAARFSTTEKTDPGAYPAYCKMSTGFFPEGKPGGTRLDHLPTSSAEVKGKVEIYIYFPSGPSSSVLGLNLP